tara:strand:+ start:444 stop:857 length:414 start_codon:yes stop_codon:yes gene_type:complete
MTQEQFFDQLNEIFDCDDGYINHLERIKKLEEEVHDWKQVGDSYFIETPEQLDEWLMASIHEDDEEYSKYMEPLELRQEVEKLKAENEKLKKDYDELFQVAKKRTEKDQEEIKKLKEVATKNYQSQIQKTLMGVQSA